MNITAAEIPASMVTATADGLVTERPTYLFGPLVDFLFLGGSTLLLMLTVFLIPNRLLEYSQLLAWSTLIAHAINNPHFAHSYHLFYRGFMRRGFSNEYPTDWRARYLFAGITVPLLLLVFFTWCLTRHDVVMIGYSVNLMFFSVGWHYVKQGYGMLMLDSVLKRRFFDEAEKRILLFHAYSLWLLSWMVANEVVAKYDFWGIAYYTFGVPEMTLKCTYALAAFTGGRVLLSVALRLHAGKPFPPINGLVGFIVASYIWLLYRNPILALAFPAMHSLQYLVVVWRYELNYQKSRLPTDSVVYTSAISRLIGSESFKSLALRMSGFYAFAVALGYFGFWYLPGLLKNWMPEISAAFGGWAFFLVTWIFINVHHYFMDSVIWRKGNPETGRYLFR